MTQSESLFQTALSLIPGGVNSPVRSCQKVGRSPIYFAKGEGPHLWDVDGKQYVDFCLSFGPHILGHCPPVVVRALQDQAALATSFGANHPQEIECVQLLLQGYPFLDKARLVNSGTEAVMTAIRLARGYTGRNKILQFDGCYHGHSDGLLARAGSGVAEWSEATSRGVPPAIVAETLTTRLDDLDSIGSVFKRWGPEIATVILEPVPANYGLWIPSREHLAAIVDLAKAHGSLVLFDEVISGFRLGLSGASGLYDIKPDLVTLGKIIGGGLPMAAVLGRAEIMDVLAPLGSVYQAGTLSGNPMATAAGISVLRALFENPPYKELDGRCREFSQALSQVLAPMGCSGVRSLGSIFWMEFGGSSSQSFPPTIDAQGQEKYRRVFQQALEQGVYFAPSPYEVGFLSVAHTDAILRGVLEVLRACVP